MKDEIIREWIEALRSGEFSQVSGTLCQYSAKTGEPVGYCCLGVLEFMRTSGAYALKIPSDMSLSEEHGYGALTVDSRAGMPTDQTYSWSGLDRHIAERLADANDNGMSFRGIAQLLERMLNKPEDERADYVSKMVERFSRRREKRARAKLEELNA